jgi:hypothetical protein
MQCGAVRFVGCCPATFVAVFTFASLTSIVGKSDWQFNVVQRSVVSCCVVLHMQSALLMWAELSVIEPKTDSFFPSCFAHVRKFFC